MLNTKTVLHMINSNCMVNRAYVVGQRQLLIKYNYLNRVELWLGSSLTITEYSYNYGNYLVKERLPINGLSKDEYFNLSTVMEIPDMVLTENINQILDALSTKLPRGLDSFAIEIRP